MCADQRARNPIFCPETVTLKRDVIFLIDTKSKRIRPGRRINGREMSVAQEEPVLCSGDILVAADNIAGLVNPECLGLNRVRENRAG